MMAINSRDSLVSFLVRPYKETVLHLLPVLDVGPIQMAAVAGLYYACSLHLWVTNYEMMWKATMATYIMGELVNVVYIIGKFLGGLCSGGGQGVEKANAGKQD